MTVKWETLTMPCGEIAEGGFYAYLVLVGKTEHPGVTLTRVRKGYLDPAHPLALFAVGDAARDALHFPLGRGPGRPAGEPELRALMAAAKRWAETYEEDYTAGRSDNWRLGEVVPLVTLSGDRRQRTDWAWGDGTPLPEDRWPPAGYAGELASCGNPFGHRAHYHRPPDPWNGAGALLWCPGLPEAGSKLPSQLA